LVQCKCRLCGNDFERKIKPIQIKMFCGTKCSKSIEGLLLDFTEIEANEIRQKYINNKKRTLSAYIEKYGEEIGKEIGKEKYNNYINKHKDSLSEIGYIKKYGEEIGKEKWKEYKDKVSKGMTQENFIKKYGDEIGIEKWDNFLKTRVQDVKSYSHKIIINEKSFIEKYGEEIGKEKWKQTSLKKKKSLARNFELKHNGDEFYELYIMEFDKYIKIGISKNTNKRFKQISNSLNQSGIFEIYACDSYYKIRNLEKYLHNKFDKYNIILDEKINGFTEFFDIKIKELVLKEIIKEINE